MIRLSLVAVIAMSACSAPVVEPPPKKEQPLRVVKPFNSGEVKRKVNNYSSSCLSYQRDSITCRTKRVQGMLGEIKNNLENVLIGVGDCVSCR